MRHREIYPSRPSACTGRLSDEKVLLNASFSVAGVYSSGAEVLTAVSALPNGVVICARLPDLSPAQLAQMLPDGFDLIELVSSGQIPVQGYSNVVSLHLPLNRLEFIGMVQTLACASGIACGTHGEQGRSSGEKELVARAKALLMRELSLSEPEATVCSRSEAWRPVCAWRIPHATCSSTA